MYQSISILTFVSIMDLFNKAICDVLYILFCLKRDILYFFIWLKLKIYYFFEPNLINRPNSKMHIIKSEIISTTQNSSTNFDIVLFYLCDINHTIDELCLFLGCVDFILKFDVVVENNSSIGMFFIEINSNQKNIKLKRENGSISNYETTLGDISSSVLFDMITN